MDKANVEGGPRVDDTRQLPVTIGRDPLTETEAQRVGIVALRLPRLREMLKEAKSSSGSIVIGSGYGAKSHALGSVDLEAALALLIERDELFMASMGVTIERPD